MPARTTQIAEFCWEVQPLDGQYYPSDRPERFTSEIQARSFELHVIRHGKSDLVIRRDRFGFVCYWEEKVTYHPYVEARQRAKAGEEF